MVEVVALLLFLFLLLVVVVVVVVVVVGISERKHQLRMASVDSMSGFEHGLKRTLFVPYVILGYMR